MIINPTLSVIIATRNCAADLYQCLTSAKKLFSQMPDQVEIVVKDNSSDDSVQKVVAEFATNLNIKYISKTDSGIYQAWNQALPSCSGRWTLFVGADDRFNPDACVSEILEALLECQSLLLLTPVNYISADHSAILVTDLKKLDRDIRFRNPFHHQGVFHVTEVLKQVKFDEEFRICGDFNSILKMYRSKSNSVSTLRTEPLVHMTSGGVSSQAGNSRLRLRERELARRNNNIRTLRLIVMLSYLSVLAKEFLLKLVSDESLSHFLFMLRKRRR